MSDAGESSAQGDQAGEARGTVDAYVLVGEEMVVLARHWTHGDQAGFTVEKIFARTSGYEDLHELQSIGELFPEVSSESIAEDLVSGELQKLDSPLPIPAPRPRLRKKQA